MSQQLYTLVGTGNEELFPVPASRHTYWQLQSFAGAPLTYGMPHHGRRVPGGILLPPVQKGMSYKLVLGSHQPERVA